MDFFLFLFVLGISLFMLAVHQELHCLLDHPPTPCKFEYLNQISKLKDFIYFVTYFSAKFDGAVGAGFWEWWYR